MKGKNGITDSDIDAHQRYYKINIRSHSTAQAMNKAIWGTFLHLTSTDEKPRHHWCELQKCWYLKYQKEKQEAKKKWDEDHLNSNAFYPKRFDEDFYDKKIFPGHVSMKRRIKFEEGSEPWRRIKNVYTRLSNIDLLKRCEEKFTTNQNESMHRRWWLICPKNMYFGLSQLVFSICQNALVYHFGYEKGNLLEHFQIEATQGMKSFWSTAEYDRKRVVPLKAKRKIFKTDDSYSAGAY